MAGQEEGMRLTEHVSSRSRSRDMMRMATLQLRFSGIGLNYPRPLFESMRLWCGFHVALGSRALGLLGISFHWRPATAASLTDWAACGECLHGCHQRGKP